MQKPVTMCYPTAALRLKWNRQTLFSQKKRHRKDWRKSCVWCFIKTANRKGRSYGEWHQVSGARYRTLFYFKTLSASLTVKLWS